MKKEYRDYKNRICCYADAATGLIEHEYKKVRTKTCIPIGGEYQIERDDAITILKRINSDEFEVTKLQNAA